MKRFTSWMMLWAICLQVGAANAAQSAKVLLVRGHVTKLLPGKYEASPVKKGETLPEDTSLLTSERSLVRLRLGDNSTMNLGPNSKVVITKMPEKKANMISLLTGAIKAEVDKKDNKENRNKMIVKTRSAVMGVRGTKFQASYNPVNKNTGLVTVEGRVAMVNKPVVAKERVVLPAAEELNKFDETLKKSEAVVEVPAGRFAGVGVKSKEPSKPVKIAPEQYDALAKSMGHKEKANEVMATADADAEVAELEGASRPGGYVDFETGIYVPPPKNAQFDASTATYLAKDMGKVDEKTGDYIPPKGVKLDPKKGFVVDKKEVALMASSGEKEAFKRAMASIDSVKNEVNNQIILKKKKPVFVPGPNQFQLEVIPYAETLELKSGNDQDIEYTNKSADDVLLVWKRKWNDKVHSLFKLGGASYRFNGEEGMGDDPNGEDTIISFGASYAKSERLDLEADFVSRPLFFVAPSDSQGRDIIYSAQVGFLSLGAKYHLWNWEKFSLSAGGRLLLFGEHELETLDGKETIDSFGLRANLSGQYDYSKRFGMRADLFGRRIEHEVTSAHDARFVRSTFGLGLNLNWNL